MKQKINLKLKLKSILFMIATIFLLQSSQSLYFKNNTFAESTTTSGPLPIKELAENILPKQWDTIKNSIDFKKPTIILGAGGGYALDDDFKYKFTKADIQAMKDFNISDQKINEYIKKNAETKGFNISDQEIQKYINNIERKMNDFSYILMYTIAKHLTEYGKFNVLLLNKADDSIIEVSNEKDIFTSLLPDIAKDSNGKYTHYYGAKNQFQTIKYYIDKFAETTGCSYDYDEETYMKKYKIPEKSVVFVSLQTNNTDTHNAEGFEAYYNSIDKNGEILTKNVTENCRFLISKNPRAAINDTEAKGYASADYKLLPKLSKFGVETLLAFVDHTDNIKTQNKFWNKDLIDRMAAGMAIPISQHLGYNPNYADVKIGTATINGITGFSIKVKISGDDLDNFSSGYIKIKAANNKTTDKENDVNTNEKIEELKFKKENNTITLSYPFIPDMYPELEGKVNYEKEENNEFTIEIFGKDKRTNSFVSIPSNVTNFKVKLDENKKITVYPNEVYKNKLIEKLEEQAQKKQKDLDELKAAIEHK